MGGWDGETRGLGDAEMGRRGDGEIGRWGKNINKLGLSGNMFWVILLT
ncbi:hypothetical protein [Calothrix sp. UHCC 0171]|nr:hypothetical protein [Calothrix sp. UHCC 0171]MEA5573940.1 hypothetical protein [Calothrix sp. UHCC 0171]